MKRNKQNQRAKFKFKVKNKNKNYENVLQKDQTFFTFAFQEIIDGLHMVIHRMEEQKQRIHKS